MDSIAEDQDIEGPWGIFEKLLCKLQDLEDERLTITGRLYYLALSALSTVMHVCCPTEKIV